MYFVIYAQCIFRFRAQLLLTWLTVSKHRPRELSQSIRAMPDNEDSAMVECGNRADITLKPQCTLPLTHILEYILSVILHLDIRNPIYSTVIICCDTTIAETQKIGVMTGIGKRLYMHFRLRDDNVMSKHIISHLHWASFKPCWHPRVLQLSWRDTCSWSLTSVSQIPRYLVTSESQWSNPEHSFHRAPACDTWIWGGYDWHALPAT